MPENPDSHLKTGFFLRRPAEGGKGGVIRCDLLDLPGSTYGITRTVQLDGWAVMKGRKLFRYVYQLMLRKGRGGRVRPLCDGMVCGVVVLKYLVRLLGGWVAGLLSEDYGTGL